MSRTLIRGGLVITAAEETSADVLIEDESVVALAASGSSVAQSWTADTEIDAELTYTTMLAIGMMTEIRLRTIVRPRTAAIECRKRRASRRKVLPSRKFTGMRNSPGCGGGKAATAGWLWRAAASAADRAGRTLLSPG